MLQLTPAVLAGVGGSWRCQGCERGRRCCISCILFFSFTFGLSQTEPSASSFARETKVGVPNLSVHWGFLSLSPLAVRTLLGREGKTFPGVASWCHLPEAELFKSTCAFPSLGYNNMCCKLSDNRWFLFSHNLSKENVLLGVSWTVDSFGWCGVGKICPCFLSLWVARVSGRLTSAVPLLGALAGAPCSPCLGTYMSWEPKESGSIWFWLHWLKRQLWEMWVRTENSVQRFLASEVLVPFSNSNEKTCCDTP